MKVDTGLNRNGVGAADFPELLVALRRAPPTTRSSSAASCRTWHAVTIPTSPVNDQQAQRFSEMRAQAREAGVEFEVAHLCNSPAAMTRPDLAFDMVRPGIAVYGQTPIPPAATWVCGPAMTLKCPVALVRSLKAGDGVSYGHTWIADRDTTRGALPIGYADGVFRGLERSHRRADQRAARPNVGRICMDQFVVDLGPGPVDVSEGDDAILFGPGDDGELTALDWAELLGTINYEVVTSPRGRVSRQYVDATGGTR